jgi:hypothetical protein
LNKYVHPVDVPIEFPAVLKAETPA